mgnify:CR=1 FL=1
MRSGELPGGGSRMIPLKTAKGFHPGLTRPHQQFSDVDVSDCEGTRGAEPSDMFSIIIKKARWIPPGLWREKQSDRQAKTGTGPQAGTLADRRFRTPGPRATSADRTQRSGWKIEPDRASS